jgi:hypothetical protein
MEETVVYLPFETHVLAQAFCDSAGQQRATFTPKGGAPFAFAGIGAENTEIGKRMIVTPAPEQGEVGFAVKVAIEHGNPWVPSAMVQGRRYSIAGYNIIGIASEDWVDEDWNDCTVLFTWSSPPVQADEGAEGAHQGQSGAE